MRRHPFARAAVARSRRSSTSADQTRGSHLSGGRSTTSETPPFARGRILFPLIAFVVSGVIAVPTVNWAYRASGGDHTSTIGLLALVGLGIAGTGAVLRACAHNRDEIGWVDHLGKLFAVGAFAYVFWDDILLVGHDRWGDLAAVIALWLLGFVAGAIVIWVVWVRRKTRRRA